MIGSNQDKTIIGTTITAFTAALLCYANPAFAHELEHTPCPAGQNFTIAIHGGAGVILKETMSNEQEQDYRETLEETLTLGAARLAKGASALDAVETMIIRMEDDPKFNAGKGAVFSAAGRNELDAAIMDGRDRNAGTIAGVTTVKNPIRLARTVMEKSRHVMLQTTGAEDFAKAHGLEQVDPQYFYTERRYQQMKNKLRKMKKQGASNRYQDTQYPSGLKHEQPETKYGTVGAAVRDNCGDLAAGTSTGGLTAKEFGRVGDAPIIGAGTYADNRYCAVSATGTGEFFIRATIARDVCARMELADESLSQSAHHMIHKTLTDMDGDGGLVAVDAQGNYSFSFNTPGMYRGAVRNGQMRIGIFEDK